MIMKIGGLQKTTLIDYPGKIACTVFLSGCNFRCPWCYSSELVLPEKIKKQPKISEKDFFKFLKERKGLLEGCILCGGEPTINEDLPDFIKKIKKFGYLVKLDTNGSNPEMLKDLISKKLIDYVAMDIKAPTENQKSTRSSDWVARLDNRAKFKDKYEQAAGVKINLENIKKSIEVIKNSGIDYEFRMTVVPGIHTKEDILQIAREISPAKKFYLQNFNISKPLLGPSFSRYARSREAGQELKPYREEYLLEIKKEISPFFKFCEIR